MKSLFTMTFQKGNTQSVATFPEKGLTLLKPPK